MPLFLDVYCIFSYSEVDEEKIYRYNISVGVCLWLTSARYGLAAWMHWSCIYVIVVGFKPIEEL
jgi:hypothetical protein